MPIRRYLLFIGEYPPNGGWNEFVGDFDTLIDAMNTADCILGDWWHIVDTDTNTIVRAKNKAA